MSAVQLTGGAAGFCQKFSKVGAISYLLTIEFFSEFVP
jgi:hypothetical protein